ncbi:MAG TPA: AMP-binding protein [Candidatus Baltobacteraceae bacterium]|nr:AMP-binding protein [Candidatus Baltobacteraceae bacterium]
MSDAEFVWNVPAEFNFARDVVDRLAEEDRLGLLALDTELKRREYSFPEISDASKRWAAVFHEAGIAKGDRVIVVLPKIPDWLFCMTALLRIGAVSVPSAEQLRAKDLAYRANHSDAVAIVGHVSNAAEIDAMRPDAPGVTRFFLVGGEREGWTPVAPLVAAATPFDGVPTVKDDMAFIIYTSGTTKDPKGVVHTVAFAWGKRVQAAYWFGITRDDLVWCSSSTGWAKSLWNVLLGPWSCGAPIVLHEGAFVPEQRMDLIRDLGVSALCMAPTEYRLCAKIPDLGKRWKLPKLKKCVSAGEPLNPEVIERWREAFGITILDGYGQSENTLLVANRPGLDVRPGSMGKPTPGHDVAVIDENGKICEPGETGDIAIRGNPPSQFVGYFKNPQETASTRRGEWYVTGDRATVDDDGYFWFVGRADDVISSGAYRIGPFEVESALMEHPAVLEPAVVGSPDPDRGNVVKAFIVLRPGYEPSERLVSEIQEHCKRVTAPYKYPREIEFVSELPKTRSGKVRRVELRQAELRKKGATAASGFV